MSEKKTQKHIRLENLLRMLSESSFIESSIFDLESGFSIVESGFLKRESEHESGFFPSPDFLRVRVQVRVRVRSGFRSMPFTPSLIRLNKHNYNPWIWRENQREGGVLIGFSYIEIRFLNKNIVKYLKINAIFRQSIYFFQLLFVLQHYR